MNKTTNLIVIFILFLYNGFCQETQKTQNDKQNMEVVLQQEAFYPPGEKALWKYFFKNINYSQEAIDAKTSGNVTVSFDVQTDSTLSNIKVIEGIGMGVDEEVVRLLKPLKYAPSIQNGVPLKMNIMVTIPIRAKAKQPKE